MNIVVASSFFARLRGLMATNAAELSFDALLLPDCKSVHTFGMRYALDLAFLDRRNRVLRIRRRVAPNRICLGPPGTVSVLERPSTADPWLPTGAPVLALSALSTLKGVPQ
jgi:uncharacterized membrane protein (UPF0127 family)